MSGDQFASVPTCRRLPARTDAAPGFGPIRNHSQMMSCLSSHTAFRKRPDMPGESGPCVLAGEGAQSPDDEDVDRDDQQRP